MLPIHLALSLLPIFSPGSDGSEAASGSPMAGLPMRPDFLSSQLWDDGQAEVSHYRSTRTIYGKERSFETTLIVVKEQFGTVSRVKQERPHRLDPPVDAVKLNIVQRIETDNYPYQYLVHVLVERADPFALLKESVSSQEWCGTTFQQIGHKGQAWQYWWDSYWQGEGHGFRILPVRPLSEEQLLLALRGVDWKAGLEAKGLPVIWNLHKNRAVGTAPLASTIRCVARETRQVPAGTLDCWMIEVGTEADEGESARGARFAIECASPHALVEFEGSEGRTLRLEKRSRRIYW